MEPVLVTVIENLKTAFVNERDAHVWLSAYMTDNTPALMLTTPEGEQIGVASVNLSEYGMTPSADHVFIKDYSENEGLMNALVEAGVIGKPVRSVPCGWESAHECPLGQVVLSVR